MGSTVQVSGQIAEKKHGNEEEMQLADLGYTDATLHREWRM